MKYIRIDIRHDPGTVRTEFVYFSERLIHADMADAAKNVARQQWPSANVTVGSAGFVGADFRNPHGYSESLRGLMAAPSDEERMNCPDAMAAMLPPPAPPRYRDQPPATERIDASLKELRAVADGLALLGQQITGKKTPTRMLKPGRFKIGR